MRNIVLDFDGPIFDGRKAAHSALEKTLEHFQDTYRPSMIYQNLPLFSPNGYISLLYRKLGRQEREPIRKFYQEQLRQIERKIGIGEDVLKALQELASAGLQLAIFTSRESDDLEALLTDQGIGDLFYKEFGCRPRFSKPSGDYFRFLSEQFRVPVSELLYVGDSDWDYMAASEAKAIYYHACWTGEPSFIAPKQAKVRLKSLGDLVAILLGEPGGQEIASNRQKEMLASVEDGEFVFYAGAGVSMPSGIGGWEAHYHPVLDRLSAGYLEDEVDLPAALQLFAADPIRARHVFDAFRDSFVLRDSAPNEYHYAMMRSNAARIWTSNYDDLFEQANSISHFKRRVVKNDSELLESFSSLRLIIKMNGDFQDAHYHEDLNWGIVFLQEQFDRAERDRPEIWRLFEDDYRQRSIIFVGMSFRDPVLRRIITLARQKITRTRRNHFLIAAKETDPAGRVKQMMFAENLRRASISTIFRDSQDEVQEMVRQIALAAYRPVVGFSGHVRVNSESEADAVHEGFKISAKEVSMVCGCLGGILARKKFRVTSGGGPYVGVPAVEEAFKVDPTLARFYFRKNGGSTYKTTAPAIVVSEDDYTMMRTRFIQELSLLVGIGGTPSLRDKKSGTIEEIEMALARGVPVILLPSAGGDVGDAYDRLRTKMLISYEDDHLRKAVVDINEEAALVPAPGLYKFVRDRLPGLLHKMLFTLMGARTPLQNESRTREW